MPPDTFSPNNLNNLPTEILSTIVDFVVASSRAAYLDLEAAQRQLAHLCSVSRALLPIARDCLYHKVHLQLDDKLYRSSCHLSTLKEDQADAIDLRPTLRIVRTLLDHRHLGHYVRRLSIGKSLQPPASPNYRDEHPEIAELLNICPYLDAICVSFVGGVGMDLGGIVAPLNLTQRKLKSLSVGRVEKPETVRGEKGLRRALATFFDTQTEVKELIMQGDDGHLAISTDPPAWQLQKLTTNSSSFAHLAHHSRTTLESLDLSYTRNSTISHRIDLTPFIALQALCLRDQHFGRRRQVDQHSHPCLPLFPPSLTTLHIRFSATSADMKVNPLFPFFPPSLVHLDLRHTSVTLGGLSNLLSKGLLPRLKTLWYTRPSPPSSGGASAAPSDLPRVEEEERLLCDLGCGQGVRIIPEDPFIE